MNSYFLATFVTVCMVWLASELGFSLSRRADAASARLRDARSLAVINVAIYGSIPLAAWAAAFRSWQFGIDLAWLKWLGLVVIIAGIALKWFAVFTLQKFFTVDVAVFDDHRLITHGPYRYVRHPSYTGVIISFFGLGMAFGSWLAVPVLVLPITLAFLWRIRIEERSMCERFAGSYQDYRKRTKTLVPFLI